MANASITAPADSPDAPLSLHHPSFAELLRVFARIGVLSFGGPAGQIALMHRELVDERRWIDEDSYLHALNFCHLLPGPEAQQLATWIGWRLHGLRGGLAAGLLFVLPGAFVILALSMLYGFAARLDWFAALFLVALFFIPESPRYLVARGLRERASSVLARLYGAVQGERTLVEIDASLAKDHHRPRLSDLVNKATGRIRPIVWVGIGLATFQQFVGINVVFYYGAVLWQAVGFSENDALLINVLSGALRIGACLVTEVLVDKVGRKPLLWVGSVGMAVSLALVTWAFATGGLDAAGKLQLTPSMGTLALVAANVYVIFFNVSWGPVMWVMLGEMFPNQIRGSGLAVAGAAQWTSNFAITVTFPMLLAGIGLAGAYGIYTVAAVVSVFFVLKYVYETKGKELEQMEG